MKRYHTSGDVKKFIVVELPSLRFLKLRLNEVRIAFSSLSFRSSRVHYSHNKVSYDKSLSVYSSKET